MIQQMIIDILVFLISLGILIEGLGIAFILYGAIYVYILEPFQQWIRGKINGKKHSI